MIEHDRFPATGAATPAVEIASATTPGMPKGMVVADAAPRLPENRRVEAAGEAAVGGRDDDYRAVEALRPA